MEFQEVVARRRMVRRYVPGRRVPIEAVDAIVANLQRGPSAGFSQGFGFLVLDEAGDIARFRTAATPDADPESWYAATFDAPLVIVCFSNKDAYLDRYALPDKGHADRSEEWWPVPYWDVDTGFASMLALLTAVDHGLGACFFGVAFTRLTAVREAFDVPEQFKAIGAISVGYSDEASWDARARRKPTAELVHRGRWTT